MAGLIGILVYLAHHRLQPLNETPAEVPLTGQQEFEAYLTDNTTSSALDYWHCNNLKYPHLYELHLQLPLQLPWNVISVQLGTLSAHVGTVLPTAHLRP